jgi:hypothetical protein
MKDDARSQHPHAAECPRRRLAEGAIAAVDECQCGMLQLHIGAITLRLAPCALSELLATLSEAAAAHAGRRAEPAREIGHGPN